MTTTTTFYFATNFAVIARKSEFYAFSIIRFKLGPVAHTIGDCIGDDYGTGAIYLTQATRLTAYGYELRSGCKNHRTSAKKSNWKYKMRV